MSIEIFSLAPTFTWNSQVETEKKNIQSRQTDVVTAEILCIDIDFTSLYEKKKLFIDAAHQSSWHLMTEQNHVN